MRNLVHMQATNHDGVEYVSICHKKHKTKLDMAKWVFSKDASFAHSECDVCQFDRGEYPQRLASIIEAGLTQGANHGS
jgi:hypothetical protein